MPAVMPVPIDVRGGRAACGRSGSRTPRSGVSRASRASLRARSRAAREAASGASRARRGPLPRSHRASCRAARSGRRGHERRPVPGRPRRAPRALSVRLRAARRRKAPLLRGVGGSRRACHAAPRCRLRVACRAPWRARPRNAGAGRPRRPPRSSSPGRSRSRRIAERRGRRSEDRSPTSNLLETRRLQRACVTQLEDERLEHLRRGRARLDLDPPQPHRGSSTVRLDRGLVERDRPRAASPRR